MIASKGSNLSISSYRALTFLENFLQELFQSYHFVAIPFLTPLFFPKFFFVVFPPTFLFSTPAFPIDHNLVPWQSLSQNSLPLSPAIL